MIYIYLSSIWSLWSLNVVCDWSMKHWRWFFFLRFFNSSFFLSLTNPLFFMNYILCSLFPSLGFLQHYYTFPLLLFLSSEFISHCLPYVWTTIVCFAIDATNWRHKRPMDALWVWSKISSFLKERASFINSTFRSSISQLCGLITRQIYPRLAFRWLLCIAEWISLENTKFIGQCKLISYSTSYIIIIFNSSLSCFLA